jgi:energy-coupling factor transport system permease protein
VNIAPRYLGRGSWLARRDPRLLVLVVFLFVFTAAQVWDGRLMVGLAAIAFGYYRLAEIPFSAVRRNWTAALTLITFIVLVNTVLTGNRFEGMILHPYFNLPVIGTPIAAETISYALTQWLRYVSMVAVGFPVAFCVAPSDFGVTFARLGIPDKLAFAVDLTFRFLPSLAGEYQQTIDAQRIRGYDPAPQGNPVRRLRRSTPLIVPFAVNAIAGAEDTIDAMDLRAFGTGRRTWVRHLVFDRADWLILGGFIGLLATVTIAGLLTSTSRLWTPQFLIDLAGS